MHGAHRLEVVVNHASGGAAPLEGIALEAPDEAHVGVGVHENFELHPLAQTRFVERKNTLEHDDWGRKHAQSLERAGIFHEVVGGHLHRNPVIEGVQVLTQQGPVEGGGVVVVGLEPSREGYIALVAIKVVLNQQRHFILAHRLEDAAGYGGFAAATASSHLDDKRRVHERVLLKQARARKRSVVGKIMGLHTPSKIALMPLEPA